MYLKRACFSNQAKGDDMNKDQVKGTVKEAAGAIQKKVGDVIGNPSQQGKGLLKEAEGKAQKHLGNVKETIKDASKKI
jgi:uncharacterized protein YjbJ (UPF0337 family)